MKIRRHIPLPSLWLCLLTPLLSPGTAFAGVTALATYEPQNPYFVPLSTPPPIITPTFAYSEFVTDIGFSEAAAYANPGSLAGVARVNLSSSINPYAAGVLSAESSGSMLETITVGNMLNTGTSLVSTSSLGIDRVELTFLIKASGSVSGGRGSQFNQYSSSIDFLWSLAEANGGGSKSIHSQTEIPTGDISSQTRTVSIRPGENMQLNMSFQLRSEASLQGYANSGLSSSYVSTSADFSHTLEWGGILGISAFDATGQAIALAPDAQLSLLGDSGKDFWYSAAQPPATGVPDAGNMLTAVALTLTGLICARRHAGKSPCAPAKQAA